MIYRVQIFQSKCLCQIIKAPLYGSNHSLHLDLSTALIQNISVRLQNHSYLLITTLLVSCGDAGRRLKCKWCRYLLQMTIKSTRLAKLPSIDGPSLHNTSSLSTSSLRLIDNCKQFLIDCLIKILITRFRYILQYSLFRKK